MKKSIALLLLDIIKKDLKFNRKIVTLIQKRNEVITKTLKQISE